MASYNKEKMTELDFRLLQKKYSTEELEEVLANPVILDICSGSGCIAISLQKKLGKCAVYGLDKSGLALELAKENARENGSIVTFLEMDVLKGIDFSEKCDILVSNPPYVRRDEA